MARFFGRMEKLEHILQWSMFYNRAYIAVRQFALEHEYKDVAERWRAPVAEISLPAHRWMQKEDPGMGRWVNQHRYRL